MPPTNGPDAGNLEALSGRHETPDQNLQILTGQKIDEVVLSDFSYQVELPWDVRVSITVQNVFDTEPKFSREALGYDASTGSPLGRTVRFGVRKRW